MIKSTMSFHMGTSFNEKHNNREIPVPHSDAEYGKLHDWFMPDNKSLSEAFDCLFKEAFDEYNQSIRKDRRYNSYLDKLNIALQKEKEIVEEKRRSGEPYSVIRRYKKAVKPAYEIIIGLGNLKDNPEFCKGGTMQETAKQILLDYVNRFKEENPNCYLYNASIHTSEAGTIHIHCDIIFYSESKRGQKIQASLTKALNSMGYFSDLEMNENGRRVNAITKWENHQRDIIKNMCKEKGILIIEGKHAKQHLTIQEYQTQEDVKTIELEAEKLLNEQEKFAELVARSKYSKMYLIEEENKSLNILKDRGEDLLNRSWDEFKNDTKCFFEEYKIEKQALYDEIRLSKKELSYNKQKISRLLDDIYNSNEFFILKLLKLLSALFLYVKTESIENEIKLLQERNNELKTIARKVSDSSQEVGDILRSRDIENIIPCLDNYETLLSELLSNISNGNFEQYRADSRLEER